MVCSAHADCCFFPAVSSEGWVPFGNSLAGVGLEYSEHHVMAARHCGIAMLDLSNLRCQQERYVPSFYQDCIQELPFNNLQSISKIYHLMTFVNKFPLSVYIYILYHDNPSNPFSTISRGLPRLVLTPELSVTLSNNPLLTLRPYPYKDAERGTCKDDDFDPKTATASRKKRWGKPGPQCGILTS